ncbi:thioredoxin [Parabacteroides gordonii]|uniref:Thioredoxin n=1 Tax=Parabacteroides gordonii MS-1 = DSM 23371 TaxID=1203610 RepID=A0A0F5JD99_9BACT|nr:thioredoxin [Parabacteroides gordonii]KKB55688.1 thioredoxin [Parabacteroides gordonii MS-1 = DSM 23371]MCA5581527.1 thioredoxin [Parabacteroides gordonii]RGP18200.1 thioredoxin [Parabacteroides gordonii]
METFKDIINGDKPVLVDFFATWCGPCKVMSPTVEALGKELVGQARVLKIDVDKNEAVANQYRIQSVPTLIIFKKGEAVWRTSGVMEKSALLQEIKNHLIF